MKGAAFHQLEVLRKAESIGRLSLVNSLTLPLFKPLNLGVTSHLTSATLPFHAPHTVTQNNKLLVNCLFSKPDSEAGGVSAVPGWIAKSAMNK